MLNRVIFNLPGLNAFLEVARRGSFSRAAAALNLSQPALSRRIDLIESAFGARLLERHHDGTRLTEAGKALLPHAEGAFAKLQDGAQSVRSTQLGASGEISVALVASLCNPAVVAVLKDFQREYPGIGLKLRTASSAEVSSLVMRGDASFGLRYRPESDRRIRCETIGHETMSVVCSAAHPLAKSRSVAVSRLVDETWIVWPLRQNDPEGGFQRTLASYGLRARHTMVTDSTLLQKQLIESNFGIGLLSRRSVQQEIRDGTLCALALPGMRGSLPVTLIQRRGAHMGAPAKQMISRLAATFASLDRKPVARPRARPTARRGGKP